LRSLEIAGVPPPDRLLQRALAQARDTAADPDLRADSISLLALAGPERHAALLESMIDPRQPEAVQIASIRAYGKIKGDSIGTFLLTRWRSLTPAARGDAADAMYLEPSRERMLIDALKRGDVQPWMLAFRHKRRLIMHTNPEIRDAARPILEQTAEAREAVVKKYDTALDTKADAARGREVFRQVCAKCHRLENHGAQVGPDLMTVQNQPKQWMLRNILIPNESIAQGFETYVVETLGSGTLDGVIGAQSLAGVTLRHEDGKEDIIRRQDIKNMYVTNLSAMPGDLEKQIGIQPMADLLEYLKTVQ
jgi:putative heme-binding domain-containing protein